jgi:hypothetical protein
MVIFCKSIYLYILDFNERHKQELAFVKEQINATRIYNQQNPAQPRKVIVMTHHAPLLNKGSSNPRFFYSESNHAFCSDLEGVLGGPVKFWIYGHTHWFQDMTVQGTRVISNPRGYPRENDSSNAFNPAFVISM